MQTITTHTTPAVEAYLAHQGEARWYGDSLFEFLVPSKATGGTLSVFRATMPEGFSPPRHIHTRHDEVFLVVDGDVAFDVDGRRLLAGSGTSVWMPRGVPHTFRIQSAAAQLLGVMTPGDFEELFHKLGVPAGERALPPVGTIPLDIPAVMAEQRRLGTDVVGPPMGLEEAEIRSRIHCCQSCDGPVATSTHLVIPDARSPTGAPRPSTCAGAPAPQAARAPICTSVDGHRVW